MMWGPLRALRGQIRSQFCHFSFGFFWYFFGHVTWHFVSTPKIYSWYIWYMSRCPSFSIGHAQANNVLVAAQGRCLNPERCNEPESRTASYSRATKFSAGCWTIDKLYMTNWNRCATTCNKSWQLAILKLWNERNWQSQCDMSGVSFIMCRVWRCFWYNTHFSLFCFMDAPRSWSCQPHSSRWCLQGGTGPDAVWDTCAQQVWNPMLSADFARMSGSSWVRAPSHPRRPQF